MPPQSNFNFAKYIIATEFEALAFDIPDNMRETYFDGRNRDAWMDAFIARLQKRYQQPDRIASND
jgi:hypothetical protein